MTTTPDDAQANAAAQAYGWIGGLAGDWGNAANWATSTQDPAASPPGPDDSVTFDSPDSSTQEIDGTGSAASLTLNGSNRIGGQIATALLEDHGPLSVSAGASLSATDATVGNTVEVQGAGASFSVSDDLVSSVTLLQAADGGLIRLGGLTLTGSNSLMTDAASAIEIGSASLSSGVAPAKGAITIDPHATLKMADRLNPVLAAPIIDDGTLSMPSGSGAAYNSTIDIDALSGTGQVVSGAQEVIGSIGAGSLHIAFQAGTYSSMSVLGSIGSGNILDFSDGGSLSLSADGNGLYDMAGTIANFTAGSTINLYGHAVTEVRYDAGSGGDGSLSLLSGFKTIGRFDITGNYAPDHFLLSSSGGDSVISLDADQFSFADGILDVTTTTDHAISLSGIESMLPSLPTEIDVGGDGVLTLDASNALNRLQIDAGASATLSPSVDGLQVGTVQIAAGGTLMVPGGSILGPPATLRAAIIGDGTIRTDIVYPIDLDGSVSSGTTIDIQPFFGYSGIRSPVKIEQPGNFAGTIQGFLSNDGIDLTLGTDPVQTMQVTTPEFTTVTLMQDGRSVGSLRFAGDYTGDVFSTTSYGAVTETEAPCYCRGTRILTPQGEVPVEALRIGQAVTTRSGQVRPIRWIGMRCYGEPFSAANADVHPVRIARHALAEGVPARDLLVSPLHALYLDGVLVPAQLLLNGRTITQIHDMARIEYFHVELETHDILLAEGAPAESFVDCDSRQMFANAAEFDRLYPQDDHQRWAFCAPRVEDGARLARIRATLEQRAAQLHGRPAQQPGPVHGHLDFLDRETASGWAWMPDHPDESVLLEIADDDGVIGRTVANRLRSDVRKAGFGTGRYGFVFRFPTPLCGISAARIHVRAIVDRQELEGSPRILPAAPRITAETYPALAEALLAGAIQAAAPERIDETIDFLQGVVQDLRNRRGTASLRRHAEVCSGGPLAIVVDDHVPDPLHSAGGQAILSHMRSLVRLGYTVLFVPLDMQAGLADEPGLQGCALPHYPSVEAVLRQHGQQAAVVYLHRISNADRFAGLVRHTCPRARLVYAVADLHCLRLARQARLSGNLALARQAEVMSRLETAMAARVDAVITHSSHEAALLRQLVPHASVEVVPWQIQPPPLPAPDDARTGIAFIGGWAHAPNQDAIRFLLEAILPRLNSRLPTIPCSIIGAGVLEGYSGQVSREVAIMGHVPDLATLLGRVRLTVAPLRFGAGIKGKVLESFAHGLPCVMTPVAAEGLALDETLQECVGHDLDHLVALIRSLHDDRPRAMRAGEAGRRLVARSNSETAVDAALSRAVASPLAPVSRRKVG